MGTAELWVLFSSSFLSATLLPGGSEINLIYLLRTSEHPLGLLITVATLGNTLGGLTNYGLGYLASRGFQFKYFEKEQRQSAIDKARRYGAPVLLLAWVPVVGDPLCLAAGYLRTTWWQSVFFMTFGKGLRYVAVVYLSTGMI